MTKTRSPRCAVLVPSGRSWEADTAMSVISIISYAAVPGVPTMIINEKSSVISQARNNLVARAREHGAEYGLFIDTDIVAPPETLCHLLSHKRDIVGCFYPKRVHPYETLGVPLLETLKSNPFSGDQVVEYAMLPAGCLLIRLSIFDFIPEPWFFETQRRPGRPVESMIALLADHCSIPLSPDALAVIRGKDVKEWCDHEHDVYKSRYLGKYISEDYNFCIKARRYGYKIWCDMDWSFRLGHIGEHIITCQKPDGDFMLPSKTDKSLMDVLSNPPSQ